jgi:cyclopropane fatty-acyl-phospholipid synthase-like methyltransferase
VNEWSLIGGVVLLVVFISTMYLAVLRSSLSLAPWVPTRKRDYQRVAAVVDIKPGERLVEAGCGDGRVAVYLARHFPEATVVGYELSVVLFLWARWRAWRAALPNLTIRFGDVLKQDLSSFDVVYVYGLTRTVNQKLLPKLKTELRPGARLVSYAFSIQSESSVVAHTSDTEINLYVYTTPG